MPSGFGDKTSIERCLSLGEQGEGPHRTTHGRGEGQPRCGTATKPRSWPANAEVTVFYRRRHDGRCGHKCGQRVCAALRL